jgi:hypothetical protein
LVALEKNNKRTADFIWKLDSDWMNKRAAREVWEDAEDFPGVDYQPYLELKQKYINLIKKSDIKGLREMHASLSAKHMPLPEAWDDILSHSPSWKILLQAINAAQYRGSAGRDDIFEEIINLAIQKGNTKLVDESEQKFGDKYDWLYWYYLQSPHPEGDKLAFKHFQRKEITPDVADAIGYRFGNRDILLKYINKYPKDNKIVLINSFLIFSEDELIDLFPWDECIDEETLNEWLEGLDFTGYDYLIRYVESEITLCNPEDED